MDNSLYGKIKQTEQKQKEQEPKIKQLEQENLSLKLALAETEERAISNDIETKLAIAELAESVVV